MREALTTDTSLWVDLVLQFPVGHLHDGDAPMRERIDELDTAHAGDRRADRLRYVVVHLASASIAAASRFGRHG